MPSLPNKSIKGTAFKKWAVESIDKLIDYLSSNWLQAGNGIVIRRTPSGTVIELQKQNASQQSAISGSTASGLTATVDGGTASVAVSGNYPLIIEPGNANVQISGGTNGELFIGASALVGMPNYSYASQGYLETFTVYQTSKVKTYNQSVFLIGRFSVDTASSMSGSIQISLGSLYFTPFDLTIGNTSLYGLSVPFCYLVPANTHIEFYAQNNAIATVYVVPLQ